MCACVSECVCVCVYVCVIVCVSVCVCACMCECVYRGMCSSIPLLYQFPSLRLFFPPFIPLQLEQPFLEKANSKTEELRASVAKLDSTRRYTVSLPLDMTFIEEAIRELLAARRVLIASYAYGYLLKGKQAQRMFENMQVDACMWLYILWPQS